MSAKSTESNRPTSSTTAANTSSAGTPRATSVATRRNAACSSVSTRSSSPLNGTLDPISGVHFAGEGYRQANGAIIERNQSGSEATR